MTSKDEPVLQRSFLDVLENKHVGSPLPRKSFVESSSSKGEQQLKKELAHLQSVNLVHFGLILFCSAVTVMSLYSFDSR